PVAVSTVLPTGTNDVPGGFTSPSPIPGTDGDQIGAYTFNPVEGEDLLATVPALDTDSDNDGLFDYEEVNITSTDPLDQDSDNDTLMDSDELIASGSGLQRSFDQVSDPLDINTDDDLLFDPQEYSGSSAEGRDDDCPFVNNPDSDGDGILDGEMVEVSPPNVITSAGSQYSYVHYEDFIDLEAADEEAPGVVRTVPTSGYGEQQDDNLCNVCDSDSDGDGLNDGEEISIGTNPGDWDTDDDGRNDWHEHTGGGPIATDPFDPDTDDDGLLDSAEVFGDNTTNPVNADTDGDGLCDGGAGTPWMVSGDARVVVNPICKSCSTPGFTSCGTSSVRTGSADGIGDHPNPKGLGEDENGNGAWDDGETDPNQFDTDGDAVGDGVEKLGFSTSRQDMIPSTDLFGRPIEVTYPATGCMDPLDPDTDGDGLTDGYEDRNHDGNFDFLESDFDHPNTPLPGAPTPNPEETNPCDPDTDNDGLTDDQERNQPNPSSENPFNPTNPLDHDTDNDWLLDGEEVAYVCTPITYTNLDNDNDGLIDEDPINGIDDDLDGYIDEDPEDFRIRFVEVLDPTDRDSDSDGFIDGRDPNPCNSPLIPILREDLGAPVDSDDDGFSDESELLSGTDPRDDTSYPDAFTADLDGDEDEDDKIWLLGIESDRVAGTVVIDIDSNVLVDAQIEIVKSRDIEVGDFDDDGREDDHKYTIEYAFANQRVLQPRMELEIYDINSDLIINRVEWAE
ncbi:MAG: hypothetical protein ACLFVS_06290, partial [Candidatus Acetothermia bacterium]